MRIECLYIKGIAGQRDGKYIAVFKVDKGWLCRISRSCLRLIQSNFVIIFMILCHWFPYEPFSCKMNPSNVYKKAHFTEIHEIITKYD